MSSSPGRRQQLRWQLWLSHFTVIVITLVALVGSLVALGSIWLLRQGSMFREPSTDAQVVGIAVGNLVRRGAPEPVISTVIAEMRNGGVRRPMAQIEGERRWPFAPGIGPFRGDLQDVDYIAVVTPEGVIQASSDRRRFPPGSTFPVEGDAGRAAVVQRALAGERDTARLSLQQNGGGAFGAYPIPSLMGDRPVGAVALAKQNTPAPDARFVVARAIAAFGLATTLVLVASSVFALLFSGLAAYLLARRFGSRLERLSQAADAVAAGDLSERVAPGPPDEVGRLGERFNSMAEHLQESRSALEVEKEKAQSALQTRRDLIANVSHELRTPLASIRGHVESLSMSNGLDTDQRRQYLEIIQNEADHLGRLIDDLFALSTVDAGALPLDLKPLSVDHVIAEVAGSFAPLAREERQIMLVSNVEPDLPPVLADHQRLAQVLTNLLRNALRYTPEGGLISLAAKRSAVARVEFSVADTGLGISSDDLPHVFDRFYRGGPARDRASGGAGLGLAIVRELVEAMHGEVSVESTPGEGSRFAFTLPTPQ